MREISEYTLVGNYLVNLSDKLGLDSIKYETAKSLTEKIIAIINKTNQNYVLLPIEHKMAIVKSMISKGVFRTDPANKIVPFKQIYNYEASRFILATYSCDGSLVFKLPKTSAEDRDYMSSNIRATFCSNINLDLQNAINTVLTEHRNKFKQTKAKSKE